LQSVSHLISPTHLACFELCITKLFGKIIWRLTVVLLIFPCFQFVQPLPYFEPKTFQRKLWQQHEFNKQPCHLTNGECHQQRKYFYLEPYTRLIRISNFYSCSGQYTKVYTKLNVACCFLYTVYMFDMKTVITAKPWLQDTYSYQLTQS